MRLLNFGSMNVDHVYQVEHFVRPGETISALKLDYFCGGKGLNQSVALARAGAETYHAGMLGKGSEELEQMLVRSGVQMDYMGVSAEMTGHAVIQVDASGPEQYHHLRRLQPGRHSGVYRQRALPLRPRGHGAHPERDQQYLLPGPQVRGAGHPPGV